MNRLTDALAEICGRHLLAEKWLLAPSRRVGQQWLEAVTRSGQPVVNVHVKTLSSLAIDLAAEQMAAQELTLVPARASVFLIDRIVRRLRSTGLKYLSHLEPSISLDETVCQTISSIRLAGLDDQQLDPQKFEVAGKGHDLKSILRAFLVELQTHRYIDDAELLRLAIERVREDKAALPADLLLLVPADTDTTGLQRQLIQAFPAEQRVELPVDEPAGAGDAATTDLGLLRWLANPADAPPPIGDGSLRIDQAIGEVNEIRNVLRQCLSGQIRFDDVELLHTDMATFVPLVYESLSALAREEEALGDDLPVTFAEGIPCRYSRPGRALTMWLAWIADGYPQVTLVQMLREGLLGVPQPDEQIVSFSRISGLLRALGIGFGRDRYARHLIEKIIGLEHQLVTGDGTTDEEGEPIPGRIQALRRDLRDYQALAAFVDVLLACSPADRADHAALLAGATEFLKSHARSVSQIDRFSALRLAADIEDMGQWINDDGQASVDAWDWLANLPNEARVLGSGPRPGCLHVAHALSGGHTGRPHVFIVGLDDSRFPGAGMQDPLLLDSERGKLSAELPTAASRLDNKVRDFIRLLATLRGHVTLSYCAQGVSEDREMFPSGVILSAFRLVSGQRTADHSDLQRWLTKQGPAASFAPAHAIESVSAAEWWLWRLCGAQTVQDPEQVVLAQHPHLARGLHGASRRGSNEFTEYDGRVEAAGADLDPTQSDHRVFSPNRLQKIGKCSLMYFFEYGLGIEPPEEVGVDRNVWLDPLAAGSLLHEVFERFMRELLANKRIPDHKRDAPLLRELLAERIDHYLHLYPSPSEGVFRRQQAELEQAVRTFLREEEHYCRSEHSRPAYLEASLGMESEEHSTPLDTLDAIPVPLDGGRHVRLRGRIDRIDLVGDGAVKTFRIWDYKTGSTYGYDRANAFQQGRVLQPFLYVTMVAHRLREKVDPGAEVSHFGFFFPGRKARGERIEWSQQDLADGPRILARLVQIVTNGAFLATNDAKDCKFCGYLGICGDTERVTAASAVKLEIVENQLLAPMRDLRNG